MLKPLREFPQMDRYKKYFPIGDKTIIAYYPDIYSNNSLTPDLLVHESTHLRQQQKLGLNSWVDKYLEDPTFRLNQEIEAYNNQIQSFKDKNQRLKSKIWASETLSSSLYNNIITKEEAYKILK